MKTRLLIAEERPDTGERLAGAFRNLNCDVCLVYDANEAIVAAPTFQPQVAILDIVGLDGYGIQLALRKQARVTGTYYVACTTSSDDAVSDFVRSLGFDDRLRKGAYSDELVALLISSAQWPGVLDEPNAVSPPLGLPTSYVHGWPTHGHRPAF
jgi:DNA-binding response OmpR family regulator